MRKEVRHALQRLRKHGNKRQRHAQRWINRRLPSLWLRFDDEVTACPGCASSGLALLDVMRVRADLTGRRLAFLSGCEHCGLVFCNPLPAPERLAQFYGETGEWADARAARSARLAAVHQRRQGKAKKANPARPRKRSWLLDAIQPHVPVDAPPPGARVLDFGCGEGKLLNALQDAGWETYGIEPSSSIAFLRHRQLDAPPADGTFDLVIVHHVLEHVANPLEVLTQLGRTLRDGGWLFVSVPRLDTVSQHGDFHYCLNGRNHVIAFTDACLQTLLARAGFEIVERLDSPELDRVVTEGRPLRLRMLARRTAARVSHPLAPLDAARRALAAYRRVHRPASERFGALLPSRLRAGWIQWNGTR